MNKAFLDLYEEHLAEALRPKPVVLQKPCIQGLDDDLDDFLSMDDPENDDNQNLSDDEGNPASYLHAKPKINGENDKKDHKKQLSNQIDPEQEAEFAANPYKPQK